MKAHIYQKKNPDLKELRDQVLIIKPELDFMFEHVATVNFKAGDVKEGRDYLLESAYEATNHISAAWWSKEGLWFDRLDVIKQGRSTSVGDLIILEDESGQKEFYSVARLGFNKFRM